MEKNMATSIANQLTAQGFNEADQLLFKRIKKLEESFYSQKNEIVQLKEDLEHKEYELDLLRKTDSDHLVDISKKLNKTVKSLGEDEMIKELVLIRGKVIDHFILAYSAETGLKPSELRLIQGVGEDGFVAIYFEKKDEVSND